MVLIQELGLIMSLHTDGKKKAYTYNVCMLVCSFYLGFKCSCVS